MSWDQIVADPEFQTQPLEIKQKVADNYFSQKLADQDFLSQPSEVQAKVRANFLATIGVTPPAEKIPALASSPSFDVTENPDPFGGTAAPPSQETLQKVQEQSRPTGLVTAIQRGVVGTGKKLANFAIKARENAPNPITGEAPPLGGMTSQEFQTGAQTSKTEFNKNLEDYYSRALRPDMQPTTTAGKIASGIVEFAPDYLITWPLSGGKMASKLTEEGVAYLGRRFGGPILNLIESKLASGALSATTEAAAKNTVGDFIQGVGRFTGRSIQRAVGGGVGGAQMAAVTDQPVLETATGFAVANPVFGALGDVMAKMFRPNIPLQSLFRDMDESTAQELRGIIGTLKKAGWSDEAIQTRLFQENAKAQQTWEEANKPAFERRGTQPADTGGDVYGGPERRAVKPLNPSEAALNAGAKVDQIDAAKAAADAKFNQDQFAAQDEAIAQKGANPADDYLQSLPPDVRQEIIDTADKYQVAASVILQQRKLGPFAENIPPEPASQGGPAPAVPPAGSEPPPSPVEAAKQAPMELPEPKPEDAPVSIDDIVIDPKAPPEQPTARQAHFLKAAAGAVRGIQHDKVMTQDEEGRTVRRNATWSTREDMAPWLPNTGYTHAEVGDILEAAARGEFPNRNNKTKWHIINEALDWHERQAANAEYQKKAEAEAQAQSEEVPFDKGGYAKKPKPEQQGMDLGIKGEGLKKPEQTGGGVDINDLPLGKATNAAADRAKQGDLPLADKGGYATTGEAKGLGKQALEQPEIVKIGKKLLGKHPTISKLLRKFGGRALGVYYPNRGEWGTIELKASNFAEPGIAERVLAHEIGHADDFIPDKTLQRGNIGGSIAKLKSFTGKFLPDRPGGQGELTKEERNALRKEARRIAKQEADKIAAEKQAVDDTGLTADDVKAVWNDVQARDKYRDLYDFIARMSGPEKASILKAVMKGEIPQSIKDKFSKAKKEGRDPYADLDAREREIFDDLIAKEAAKRNLFNVEEIRDELKRLTQLWKPFDESIDPKFTKYRYNPRELYADALSVLFNDPALLQREAPQFYRAFFNYQEVRPQFRDAYNEVQKLIGQGPEAVGTARREDVRAMFDKGEEGKRALERLNRTPKKILHELYRDLLEKNAELYSKVAKVEKTAFIEDTANPRYWVEELPYIDAEIYNHLDDVERQVLKPLETAGMTSTDLGEYMFYRRVAEERGGKYANPLGHTKETATAQIEQMKKDLGSEKFAVLEKAAKDYGDLRTKNVIDVVRKAQMWTPELMKYVEDNNAYATFDLLGFLEKQYGRGGTAYVYRQLGTLQEIKNPFTATVMKDSALIRAAHAKQAKEATVKFLQAHYGDEVVPADTKWNGKYHEIIPPRNPEQGLIAYPVDGKMQAFYVSKEIAETFDQSPYQAGLILKAWQIVNIPLRNVLVSHNPMWMVFNVPRDFLETWKNIPDTSIMQLAYYYGKAFRYAWQDVFGAERPALVKQMLRNKELVTDRQWSSTDLDTTTELDRLLRSFGESPVRYRNFVVNKLVQFWNFLGDLGKVTERAGKISGRLLLDQRRKEGWLYKGRPLGEKSIGHLVKEQVGTPNVKAGGIWRPIYNNLFLFSNVAIRGFRSSWEGFKTNKSQYAWKTIKYNVLPKLAMRAAAMGLLGVTLKEIYDKISEYKKTAYQVIPLGLTEDGKGVALKLPQDYSGAVIGGFTWILSGGTVGGPKGVLAWTSQSSPYGLNPYIGLGMDWLTYMQGQNPTDSYRNQPVIPDMEFKAKDSRGLITMLKYSSNSLGGGAIYKFPPAGPEKIKTMLETALNYPPGNVIGRFLEVSNAGERENLKSVTEPIQTKEARKALDVRDLIIKNIDDGKTSTADILHAWKEARDQKLIELGDPGFKFSNFEARYKRMSEKTADNPNIDAVIYATTNEQKGALLLYYQDHMPKPEFQKLFNQLILEGYVKKSALVEMLTHGQQVGE